MIINQYFLKNHRLFKLPFKFLLSYHCPLGNTIKFWTSPYMLNHILCIRNEIQILNLDFTIIQLRKALNSVFNKMMYRGSFLIYAQEQKALKITNNLVFTFITCWLPGLVSNYKQTITALSYDHKVYSYFRKNFFKRPELDAIETSTINAVLMPTVILYPERSTRFAFVPSISLSLLDSYTWSNECYSLCIPSIQICDSQSNLHMITYPIISNQRSVVWTHLIINLFSETCNYGLMYEHLYMNFLYNNQKQVIPTVTDSSPDLKDEEN